MATPRVLVIDADRATIEALRDAIDRAGYDMEIALSPTTALTILEQRQMDAVILDFDLAELKNAAIVRDLRRQAGASPLIGIATAGIVFDEKDAVRAELSHWIEKSPDTLLSQEIERVLPSLSFGH